MEPRGRCAPGTTAPGVPGEPAGPAVGEGAPPGLMGHVGGARGKAEHAQGRSAVTVALGARGLARAVRRRAGRAGLPEGGGELLAAPPVGPLLLAGVGEALL